MPKEKIKKSGCERVSAKVPGDFGGREGGLERIDGFTVNSHPTLALYDFIDQLIRLVTKNRLALSMHHIPH